MVGPSVLQVASASPMSLYPGLQLNVASTVTMLALFVELTNVTVPLPGAIGRYAHVNVHVGVGFGIGQVESASSAVQVILSLPVNIALTPAAGSHSKVISLV